jgi:uncharacterized membrane protein
MSFGVLASYVIVFLADPSPAPTPPGFTGDENAVTPGVVGFIATAFIAIMTVLLIVDMTRRIRKVRYRAEAQEKIAAEQAEKVSPAQEG